MNIEDAFVSINESVELVIEKLKELNEENELLREENSGLRKLVGELLFEQIDNEF